MNEANADTQTQDQNPGNTPAAGSGEQDHQIPKYRLDQIAQQLRQSQEENSHLRDLLKTVAGNRPAPQQAEQGFDPEKFGLDPQVVPGLQALVQDQLQKLIAPQAQQLRQIASKAYGTAEETQFLMLHSGGDAKKPQALKAKLPELRKYRQQKLEQDGVPLSFDVAYRFMRMDEEDARALHQPRQPQPTPAPRQAPSPRQQPAQEFDDGFPTGDSHLPPGGAGNQAAGRNEEKSLEDPERELDEQARAYGGV